MQNKKNTVISSYDKEIENLSSIEKLKYEYGIEKNVVLSRDNVNKNSTDFPIKIRIKKDCKNNKNSLKI